MGESLHKAGKDIGNTYESIVTLPEKSVRAMTELFVGENPLPKIKGATKEAVGNVLTLPFSLLRHLAAGMAKGTLKLSWSLIKKIPVPVLKTWNDERGATHEETQRRLERLRSEKPAA